MNKKYKYRVIDCPICGRPIADNWFIRHMKEVHPSTGAGDLTDAETKAITESSRDGYYGWETFQWEQRDDF